ncbi:hypothetical protein L539_4415 [Bordetella hinzii 5132]|uniref:Uncharacterized protein n=1 Tax=Bordetella hinzii OH87 BAL007II TaxID=1331262 RepID=A0ABR4QXU1_9BORD|nr:hypothetical protein L544_4339 [Bordetella hinzii OH87 BAL007II]KCB42209.1 hypothetical protein L538_4241 [Bordetella hinzii 4161]KCB45662.1 hypothetical protein L539_4415 [Bordetella hinzii 5132]
MRLLVSRWTMSRFRRPWRRPRHNLPVQHRLPACNRVQCKRFNGKPAPTARGARPAAAGGAFP